ncbi:MAG TPA: sensory rhodopsin transducer [Nevskia sp.]|jgi:hypothetical protein|nr:sensory rhodopsin transducer [Nevskia sp.]
MNIGHTRWSIAEGYLPDPGPCAADDSLRSHETACILNAGERDAHLRLTVFFRDREPAGPYRIVVPARRCLHLRFDELSEPEAIPRRTDYSSLFESDVPVVIQHTRLDMRLGHIALLSTVAYGAD